MPKFWKCSVLALVGLIMLTFGYLLTDEWITHLVVTGPIVLLGVSCGIICIKEKSRQWGANTTVMASVMIALWYYSTHDAFSERLIIAFICFVTGVVLAFLNEIITVPSQWEKRIQQHERAGVARL